MTPQTQEFVAPVLPRLRAELDRLPLQAARVAQVILADPHAVARMSIADLAERASTSEASVTRLAQRLGQGGFPELRIALAAESVGEAVRPTITGDIDLDDATATVKAKVLADVARSLHDTAAALDDAAVDAVADAVVTARRTLVLGIGASGTVATDLARKLERIGLPALALTEHHDAMTTCVALTSADVLVAVSHSGETIDVVGPTQRAAAAGAATVALTSRPSSTLARACDQVLLSIAGTETAMRPAAMSSRAAQLFVVDVLFVAVVQRDWERAEPLLSASWEAVSARHPDRRRG
ncbi:MurR/RpiR family transcriptional regulator [Nocardioides mangrovicus]|uniref:MurR/RpiR family transcriptional regulator n=1 Tax=Nocardioides mangrovicus TaxID=2478913 RepID=A0A3L8P2F8_9ACTN|nr:MurR/RpiR family transcriptional regulator [Nocardioides mangrovicus]RLV49033.1 MurR/RpiR family transcriptional regulator [Nocardioides mangrovicus]